MVPRGVVTHRRHDLALEGGGWIELRHLEGERAHGRLERVELGAALVAGRRVTLDAVVLVRRGSPERDRADEVSDLVVAAQTRANPGSMFRRTRSNPSRMRLLTVPSGNDSIPAISWCVYPP